MVAYALSLLTDRQLIIALKNPCNFDKIFLPNKVNWLPSQFDLTEKTSTILDCRGSRRSNCIEGFSNAKNFETDVLYLSATDQGLLRILAEQKDFQSKILSLGLVNNIQDFKLKNLFHKWYNDLFRLEPLLEEKYDLIKKQANLNKKTKIYCAQIRIGGRRPNVEKDLQFNDRNITKTFWKFIRDKFIKDTKNWRLFVTSDMDEVEMEAIEEFGEDKVIRILGTNSHVGREKNLGNNCSRVEKPILDFHFLQNCDKAAISQSSFGRLGTYNRKQPDKDVYILGSSYKEFNDESVIKSFWKRQNS